MTILTIASDDMAELQALTLPGKQKYADRHGHNLLVKKHEKGVNITWDRPKQWLETLEGLKEGEWMWFIGSDTLITNHNIDCKDIPRLSHNGDDLLISEDLLGINCDSFFIRASFRSRRFLKSILSLSGIERDEQTAMNRLIAVSRIQTQFWPQQDFNAYLYDNYWQHKHMTDFKELYGEPQSWQLGDLLLHLPALSMQKRVEIINQILPQVIE